MKKFTLLLCLFVVSVMMPQVVMADVTITPGTDEVTITSSVAGNLSSHNFTQEERAMFNVSTIRLEGKFNAADLDRLSSESLCTATTVDMSAAEFDRPLDYTSYTLYHEGSEDRPNDHYKKVIVGGTLYLSRQSNSYDFIPSNENAYNNAQDKTEPNWRYSEWPSNTGELANGRYLKLKVYTFYEKLLEWDEIVNPTQGQMNGAQEYSTLPESGSSSGQLIKIPNGEGYKYYIWGKWNSLGESYTGPVNNYYNEAFSTYANLGNSDDVAAFLTRYDYYCVNITTTCLWITNNDINVYNNGEEKTVVCRANTYEGLQTPASADQWAIVGGIEYKYDESLSQWVEILTTGNQPDYSAMKFSNWSGLTTAILPDNVTIANCPDNLFKGCHSLLSVTHNGQTVGISISDMIVTVNTTGEAGLFRLLLNSDYKLSKSDESERFANGTTFRFATGCTPSSDDLAALAGRYESSNSQYVNHNKFYVDLFNLSSSNNYALGDVVANAIGTLRTNNWQYKGLLLPGNLASATTQYIKDRDEDGTKLATCSEFIGYNKLNNTITTMHIYSANHSGYQNSFNKLKDMMDHHSDIAQNTRSYLVSTNSPSEFDTSSLTTTNADVILAVNDDMVNPVPGAKAGVSVTLAGAGHFATLVANTGIKDTPVDSLKITGNVNVDDISAVSAYVDGPRVLNLKAAVPTEKIVEEQSDDFDDKAVLETLENNKIEFIILHSGKSKDVVCSADTSKLKSLKAVISSNKRGDANPALVAYVNVPGSLAEARYLATGGSFEGDSPNLIFRPNSQNLTSVILSGNLIKSDISTANDGGLANEAKKIESLDLEGAVFRNASGAIDPNEMNFKEAGFRGTADVDIVLKSIILPTNQYMDEISKDCFNGMHSLKSLCIPFNYKVIHDGALNETGLDHLTTTDGYDGNVVDNGPKTYTLSANLKRLGDEPESKLNDGAFVGVQPVFPKNNGVGDLYSLATKVPICYKDVFGMDLSTGYGGQDQTKVYCRERYYNNGDANNAFMILHIPNEESFNRAKNANPDNAEGDYSTMVGYYTDDTKVFSKLDQTGAVDANGKPMRWPMHNEMLRVYAQASAGLVWKDWTVGDDKDQNGLKVLYAASEGEPKIKENSSFYNYIGWHQIVLTQATYVDPVETSTRNYVKSGWYTFCIPYNLTYSQVVRMLGVPASTDNVKNYIANGEVLADSMPDIRQLKEVVRKKGSGNEHNVVNFRLTENLYKGNKVTKYLNFTEIGDDHTEMSEVDAGSGDDPICLVGGRPYYIRPYLPEDVTISKSNLGKYIMTRYANELTLAASCVNSGADYCENLDIFSYEGRSVVGIDNSADDNDKNTMRFAKPYEKHKVQAVTDDEDNPGQLVYTTESKSKSTATHKYYYTMIGQFWEQELPAYCVYMSGQQWYRYGDGSSKFKWAPYKCVIMATPEVTCVDDVTDEDIVDAFSKPAPTTPEDIDDHIKPESLPTNTPKDLNGYTFEHFGGGFRDIKNCYFPMNVPGTKALLPSPLTLWFVGRDDSSFDNDVSVGPLKQSNHTRYVFSFDEDEDIVEFDGQDNEATVIKMLDGTPQFTTGEERVYNLSGQYVGKSTEGLARGVYIVGGRKVVVD